MQYNRGGDNMKANTLLKETIKHGSTSYAFSKIDVVSDYSMLFASNHWHDETEIIYIDQGCLRLTINNKHYIGTAGDIFIINSGELHEVYGETAPIVYTALVFDFNMLSFRSDDFAQKNFITPILSETILFSNKIEKCEKAYKLLKYISEVNITKPSSYTLSTKASLLHFFSLMIENENFAPSHISSQDDEKNSLLKAIVTYIDENYTSEIELSEISNHFNMSPKYFCRFFKKHFHRTFVTYLNEIRIENSVHLLSKNNIPITEVAISCGFSNMSYFTRTFKKKIGFTPSQFKKHKQRQDKGIPIEYRENS